jgi:hypothetical protein
MKKHVDPVKHRTQKSPGLNLGFNSFRLENQIRRSPLFLGANSTAPALALGGASSQRWIVASGTLGSVFQIYQ